MSLPAIDLATIISLVTLAGLLGIYFREIASIKGDIKAITERVDCVPDMHEDVHRLSADSATFWRILEPSLGKIIHSPTHRRRDELVDRFVAGKLDEPRLVELRVYLQTLLREEPNDGVKHLAGALLLGRVESQITLLSAQKSLESR